jgi:hypothetical protein
MRCMRCQGLMVWVRFLDLAQTDLLWAFAWRCVNCGEVLDAVILSHRRHARLLREPRSQGGRTMVMRPKGTQAKTIISERPVTRRRITKGVRTLKSIRSHDLCRDTSGE